MSTRITFTEWVDLVEKTGRTKAEIASDLSVQLASLYRYLAGDRVPDRVVMARIVKLSGGRVDVNSFFANQAAKPSRKKVAA